VSVEIAAAAGQDGNAMRRDTSSTKPFGWTGVPVPAVGQGTWHMGESRRARAREVAALRLGFDLGLTHVDTAEAYGNGGAEEVTAEALRGRRRSEIFLVSKVMPQNASRAGTIRAAEQSLRRLGTDHLDLYLLHWPGRHPIGETMAAMEELVAAGKIRFIGVSNFDVAEMREAIGTLARERLACNQVPYNLAQRDIERDLIPFCAEWGVAVVGYTPFGGFPRSRSRGLDALEEIARRHGKTARQIVLRFLTRQPNVFAIPKAVATEHVRENAGAASFDLDPSDLEAIDRAFPGPGGKAPR
jgi:diketogulonate reductase-like aldo/keto reductase